MAHASESEEIQKSLEPSLKIAIFFSFLSDPYVDSPWMMLKYYYIDTSG